VRISGDDHFDIEKNNKYHTNDHHESSYQQVDDKLHYGSSSSYNGPSYRKQEPIYKVHKEEPSYHTIHKQEPSYLIHKEEPSYKMQNYKQEPSYMVHKEGPSYTMQNYEKEIPYKTYQQEPIYKSHHDSYPISTHYKESDKQHSYKEMSGYGKQEQYHDNMDVHDLYRNNYKEATELVSNAGIHRYSAKLKAPIMVKMTTMNNNKNVYNKQYDY